MKSQPISEEKTSKEKGGFTLVELSIVLVIIGLLIGGILAAQSMISTAKINAQVQQIGQFDAMVLNFKTRFNYLPGDAPQFGGDGDGVIEVSAGWGGGDDSTVVFACEIANFWNNMDPVDYVYSPNTCVVGTGAKANYSGSTKKVPLSKIGQTNSFFIATALTINKTTADKTNPENYYAILESSQAQTTILDGRYYFASTSATNSSSSPVELLALDQKIDDGVANSGNILSGSIGTGGPGVIAGAGGIFASPAAGLCSSGATYTLAHTGYECTPLIRIGVQTGNPQ